MVLGNSSKFTEGFTSFTADDDLMIANLKQALNYSKEQVAIPDPSINLKYQPNEPIPVNTNISNNLPSKLNSTTPSIPTTTNQVGMPTNMMLATTTTSPAGRLGSATTTTSPAGRMGSATTTTSPAGGKMGGGKMGGDLEKGKILSGLSAFKNIPKVVDDMEDDESDNNDETVLDEEDYTNTFEEEAQEAQHKRNKTRRGKEHIEEGFRGSMEIQSRNLRNILLALLLSCIGYLIVYSMSNNLLPLDEISPQLKKFKKLIYGGLFFLIAYICLEVF